MNDEQRDLAKQIFLVACELTKDRAAQFLDRACGQDAALRAEVESLLQHHRTETVFGEDTQNVHTGQLLRPRPSSAAELEAEKPTDFESRDTQRSELPPGEVFADRYRILRLLGRGGMADVYQAEDQRLGLEVAVKVLAADRQRDPQWVERFYNEVRLARKVTHPNVARTFDVGQADDVLYLTMEYIDGEDLESLLRRIGRFSVDKTVQLTRELCAGLGSAHEQGVLHRDLKPANVMIDGNGRARITDFGIADADGGSGPAASDRRIAGTPAYMAPELFTGGRPTIQSDLYALGLVVYLAATGREAFGGLPPWQRDVLQAPPAPSTVTEGIPPELDEAIEQCLLQRPELRPLSAYEVASTLPGVDLLDEQLAAGRIPSPTLVAAAHPLGTKRAAGAKSWLAAMIFALAAVVGLADYTFLIPEAGLDKPPAVLQDTAETTLGVLGYTSLPGSRLERFELNRSLLRRLADASDRPPTWEWLATASPPAILYWYRRGDLEPHWPPPLGVRKLVQPASVHVGMVSVKLDGKGRLVEFIAPPSTRERPPSAPDRQEPQWKDVFRMTGLESRSARLEEIPPIRTPPVYADRVKAWSGRYPDRADVEVRLEAAAVGRRIVFVDVVPVRLGDISDLSEGDEPTLWDTEWPLTPWLVVVLVSILGACVLAWRNLRRGHGDRRGTLRIAAAIFILGLVDWLAGEPHVQTFAVEFASTVAWWSAAVFNAAVLGVCYLAAEPYARRLQPKMIVTWSRLMRGRIRDSLVGRDLLIGTVAGLALVLFEQADSLASKGLAMNQPLPKLPVTNYVLGEVLGLRYKIGTLVGTSLSAMLLGFILLVFFVLIRRALRRTGAASIAYWLVITGLVSISVQEDSYLPVVVGALSAALLTGLLLQVGLVGVIAAIFIRQFLLASPVTANLEAWYAPASIFAILVVSALGGSGYYLHASHQWRQARLQSHAL